MAVNTYSNALYAYIKEFQDNPTTIDEFKVNFLKNHFYHLVENYINVERKNLLIGTTNNKNYLYFQCKLNTTMHFVYNLNNPTSNYLKFDYPGKFVEYLYSDELHYNKYKTFVTDKNMPIKNYKKYCCCCVII
tara:strand:+ start:51 stop:449 length:399 start_codon:yes stop_codon:yes gene_type:complete